MSLAPLMGLPGRVKILLDRIGSSTPTQLARLDDDVSSRAPASTALSSSTWTPTKAGYLDAAISGRASQASVDALPTNIVRSIQRGYSVFGGNTTLVAANGVNNGYRLNLTIPSVNTDKSQLLFSVSAGSSMSSTANEYMFVRGAITSSTSIRFNAKNRINSTLESEALIINWEVVEYQ